MSTTEQLGAALERASAPQEVRTIQQTLEGMAPELQKSLQSEQAVEILLRHCYTAYRFNPLLRQCATDSMIAAVLLTAQLRLEPGPLGHVYFVPFKNSKRGVHEVVFLIGYTGIAELARRGGAAGLRVSLVWDCDELVAPWEDEKGQHWLHKPAAERPEDANRAGCLVTWKEGRERLALLMPPERVDVAIRASKNPKKEELREQDWYWRKTAVRFARPWLPLTTDAAFGQAVHADGARVVGLDTEQGAAQPALETAEETSE